jgi:hypothetical protein
MGYGSNGFCGTGSGYGNGGGYGGQGGSYGGNRGGYGQSQGGRNDYGGGGGYGSGPQGGGAPNGGGYGGPPQGNGGGNGGGGGSSLPDGFDKERPYTSRIDACLNFVMRFSRYRDAKLGDLREDDEALLFFDWLRQKQDFHGIARDMVTVFLHRPEVAARLDAAIQAKRANARNRQS